MLGEHADDEAAAANGVAKRGAHLPQGLRAARLRPACAHFSPQPMRSDAARSGASCSLYPVYAGPKLDYSYADDSTEPACHMAEDHIRYDILAQEALRGVMRKVLAEVARTGLPGNHHFFITFLTGAPGVRISPRLRERYPEQMTIVMQFQYWDLKVTDTGFEVGLSFSDVPEKLEIPFSAVRGFYDPSVNFELEFDVKTDMRGESDEPRKRRQEGKAEAADHRLPCQEAGRQEEGCRPRRQKEAAAAEPPPRAPKSFRSTPSARSSQVCHRVVNLRIARKRKARAEKERTAEREPRPAWPHQGPRSSATG